MRCWPRRVRSSRRVRDLPARVVVYLLLAGCLFAELGYSQVWQRLVAGLDGLAVARPTAGRADPGAAPAGAAPLRALFELLRGPAAVPGTARGCAGGACWSARSTAPS